MEIAINCYTVRGLDEPLPAVLDRIAAAGYDGVEFAGLDEPDPETLRERLTATGLGVAGAHVPIDALETDFETTVETYRDIGCETFVIPYLDAECFSSIEAVERTATRLDGLAERLADRGIDLHYHNHDHEFTDLGDTTGFEAFVERSAVGLEPDLGWIEAAGADPAAWLRQAGDRVSLVHCKDTRAGRPVELGAGDLDLDACLAAARDVGVDWLVYEHDRPEDPAASLDHGASDLSRRLD